MARDNPYQPPRADLQDTDKQVPEKRKFQWGVASCLVGVISIIAFGTFFAVEFFGRLDFALIAFIYAQILSILGVILAFVGLSRESLKSASTAGLVLNGFVAIVALYVLVNALFPADTFQASMMDIAK